jgi:hypothetical protein
VGGTRRRSECDDVAIYIDNDDFLQAIKRDGGFLDNVGSPPFEFLVEAGYFGNVKIRAQSIGRGSGLGWLIASGASQVNLDSATADEGVDRSFATGAIDNGVFGAIEAEPVTVVGRCDAHVPHAKNGGNLPIRSLHHLALLA